ncbi:MAG TPA: VCBS repeat-containing protein, partial [Planctomycetes bacterium]|nr:VCBS repeat-containing protein [Planctomycetota bacterium]
MAWLDYDGDGNLDLYLAQSGPLREVDGSEDRATAANELWAGDGAGHFALVPGIAADTGYGQGVHAADFDGDGHVDLAALNWGT